MVKVVHCESDVLKEPKPKDEKERNIGLMWDLLSKINRPNYILCMTSQSFVMFLFWMEDDIYGWQTDRVFKSKSGGFACLQLLTNIIIEMIPINFILVKSDTFQPEINNSNFFYLV